MATRVLIAGVSARGLAESAARAGYEVVAVDGFGDLDLRACAADVRVARTGRFSARAAAAVTRDVACDAVVYEASFDNHPDAVRILVQAGRALWGNPPAVLARVRHPRRVARALKAAGFPTPSVRRTTPPAALRATWLIKPLRSGGGVGVRPWRRGMPLPRGSYLQQRIAGVPGSIVFAADGRHAVPLGLSRILAGQRVFGADGFRYCGNILAPPGDRALLARATQLAQAITAAFGLVGVNGVDFVARRGVPYPIEVNPRYTAAMELVERAHGLSIFAVHAAACAGRLPAFELSRAGRDPPAVMGKAVLYARVHARLGDTRTWLADPSVRDISPPGTCFAPRDPVCTVFGQGGDATECRAALVRRAAAVYRVLARGEPRIA